MKYVTCHYNKNYNKTYRLAQILTPGNTININSNSNNYVCINSNSINDKI